MLSVRGALVARRHRIGEAVLAARRQAGVAHPVRPRRTVGRASCPRGFPGRARSALHAATRNQVVKRVCGALSGGAQRRARRRAKRGRRDVSRFTEAAPCSLRSTAVLARVARCTSCGACAAGRARTTGVGAVRRISGVRERPRLQKAYMRSNGSARWWRRQDARRRGRQGGGGVSVCDRSPALMKRSLAPHTSAKRRSSTELSSGAALARPGRKLAHNGSS